MKWKQSLQSFIGVIITKGEHLADALIDVYIAKIKQWTYCPNCRKSIMTLDNYRTTWVCNHCGYRLSRAESENNMIYWYCDNCGTYMNVQEGFDRSTGRHICTKCGFDNDVTDANIRDMSAEEYVEFFDQRGRSEDGDDWSEEDDEDYSNEEEDEDWSDVYDEEDWSDTEDEKTIKDIIDTMNEEQQNVLYAVVASVIADYEGGKAPESTKGGEKF